MSDLDPELDIAAFPLVGKGNRFEDFTVGQKFVHHWGRTLNAGDNSLFTTATCNWTPLYVNSDYAQAHGHRDIVVNPMLVLCTVVGLSVEDLSEAGGPFLGLESCQFQAPVYPGDTIVARSECLAARESTSKPGFGIVTWRTEGHNQNGDLVVEFTRSNLIAKRSNS